MTLDRRRSPMPVLHLAGAIALLCAASARAGRVDLFVCSDATASVLRYDGRTGLFLNIFIPTGSGNLARPSDVAVGSDGNIYVASLTTGEIKRYDRQSGAFLGTFVAAGQVASPAVIAFGPDANLYVADYNNDAAICFDGRTGALLRAFFTSGSGGVDGPAGLYFGPAGNLFVSSNITNQVLSYNGQSGAPIDVFVGTGSGGLDRPRNLVFGPDGRLYVSSYANNRVLRYGGENGGFLDLFASSGGLSGPRALAFGPDANLYVVSEGSNSVLRYNGRTGQFIDTFASGGSLNVPTGMTFMADPNCNGNLLPDDEETAAGTAPDCNSNRVPDACDIAAGTTLDTDRDTIPEPCDLCQGYDDRIDCNTDRVPDGCDIAGGTSYDCDNNGVPDECQTLTWRGPDGGSFTDPANWNPAAVPQLLLLLSNESNSDNRCNLDTPGTTSVCFVDVRGGAGSGRQILAIPAGSVLRTTIGSSFARRGELALDGGEITAGTLTNNGGTLSGRGIISSWTVNQGLIQSAPLEMLRLQRAAFFNQPGGTLRASIGSGVLIQTATVSQGGELEARVQGVIAFSAPLINLSGGSITLLGGSLGTPSLSNTQQALITGFGMVDANVTNNGLITATADTQIVGNLANNGTVFVQAGLLSITGSVSGGGTIIGGAGGRDGTDGGDAPRAAVSLSTVGDLTLQSSAVLRMNGGTLTVGGNFDVAIDDPARSDLSSATLEMAALPGQSPQNLELLAEDLGGRDIVSLTPVYFPLRRLRIGPTPTTVRLVNFRSNAAGSRPQALYLATLVLEAGTTLDLAGGRIYYNSVIPAHPQAADSGVRVIDSVGGGRLCPMNAPGDFTGECGVDLADLPIFIDVILHGSENSDPWRKADMNADGRTNGEDIRLFEEALTRP